MESSTSGAGSTLPSSGRVPDGIDTLQGVFGPTSYLPESQLANGEMAIGDSDWGLSAGLLWSFAERWSLGAFYRQGPEFTLAVRRSGRAGRAGILDPDIHSGDDDLYHR